MSASPRQRVLVTLLALSAGGFAAWVGHEGTGPVTVEADGTELLHPYIPVQGDVPTIGHGSTRYEDGTPVKLTDAPITRQRAVELARNLMSKEERQFADSLPGVALYPEEYDLYLDFTGQYGIGRWRDSTMRRELLVENYRAACNALLSYRYMTSSKKLGEGWEPRRDAQGRITGWKYDCSQMVNGRRNKVCWGVWDRQKERHQKCLAAQED